MNPSLLPYKIGSKSGKSLAEALGIKRLRRQGGTLKKRAIINWGASSIDRECINCTFLNHPDKVAVAANKLDTFLALGVDLIPSYTTKKEVAQAWVEEGIQIYARTKLTGHSGDGIVFHKVGDQVVDAPLYTQRIRVQNEYRVHVFCRKVFFVQRKARKLDIVDDQVNWKIRNHQNGFIYAHKDVDIPIIGKLYAQAAVMKLGLDFGAVDLVHSKDGEWRVLEVNTACGLEGTTLDMYVDKFEEWMHNVRN